MTPINFRTSEFKIRDLLQLFKVRNEVAKNKKNMME